MSRISQLAGALLLLHSSRTALTGWTGHINRTRNVQPSHSRGGNHQANSYASPRLQHQSYVQSGRISRHGHDSRFAYHRHSTPHRNRTLVFNNQAVAGQPASSGEEEAEATTAVDQENDLDSSNQSLSVSTNWISKRDRHNQLINASHFEKHRSLQDGNGYSSAQQTTPVEGSKANPIPSTALATSDHKPAAAHVLEISGLRFQVCNDGSKLQRLTGSSNNRLCSWSTSDSVSLAETDDNANPTPQRVVIHGIEFLRSKRGNLYRSGGVKERRSVHAATALQCLKICGC